ncbi:MAG TPA: ankyrin repeat domain-containing protein [Candidatus Babeliales bacterium]|nr:ankyrin repeat domain-containing protein [Candidatus Babeliales bacterium]
MNRTVHILCAMLLSLSTHTNHSAAELEQKEAAAEIDPLTRSLLIFLDDSEPYYYDASNSQYDHHLRAVTHKSMQAINDAASPILISGSLLYNLFRKPKEYDRDKERFAQFYTTFNVAHWIIKKIAAPSNQITNLYCMIPAGYFGISEKSIQQLTARNPITDLEYDLGLKCDHMENIPALSNQELRDFFTTQYYTYTNDNYKDLSRKTGAGFIQNCVTDKALFVSQADYIKAHKEPTKWIVYLNGHGGYGETIAQLSFKEFDTLLKFLEKEILTIFFVYISCYAAGFNAKQVFGELMAEGGAQTHTFPIVTQALTDSAVTTPFGASHFNGFIQTLLREPSNYQKAIAYIIPTPTSMKRLTSIPQIRLPHVPAWFPITTINNAVVSITKIESVTRKNSLTVGTKPLLLYTDHVPFLVNFSSYQPLPVISMSPGIGIHIIDRAIFQDYTALKQFFFNMQQITYGPSKAFLIKTITLVNSDKKLSDIIIDYNIYNKPPLIFFTDEGKQKTYENGTDKDHTKDNYLESYQLIINDYIPLQQKDTTQKVEQSLVKKLRKQYATPEKLLHFLELVSTGNIDEVRRILPLIVAVDFAPNQQTALMIAAEKGYKEIVELLLLAGASGDKRNIQGLSSADIARDAHHEDIALLIENRDNIKLRQLLKLRLFPHLDFSGRRNLRYIFEQIEKKSSPALELLKDIIAQLIDNQIERAAYMTKNAFGGSRYWGKDFSEQEFEQKQWQELLTHLVKDSDIAALLEKYTRSIALRDRPVKKKQKIYEPKVPAGLML